MKRKLWILTVFGVVSVLAAGTLPAQERRMENEKTFQQMFPQGEPLPEQFSKYFTGQAWLARLTTDAALNVPVSNVTFSPGCRNNWHSHTGGQLLIAVGGRGYYQEKGRPARELLPGDVVEIAPDVVHWHGAAPDSWFSHLAVECNPATNVNTWLEPVDDAQYDAATASRPVFSEGIPVDGAKDPELFEIFDNFALGEVLGHGGLDARTRLMCILASNVASQGRAAFRATLDAALGAGVTPVEVKEVLYQAVPYVGMAKVADFIGAANDVLEARGVGLPLEGQSTTTPADRFEKGLAVQRSIFGAGHIDAMREAAPENQKHIQQYLSDNCFGDFLTRGGLDVKTRELVTFSLLVSLGGCEPQVKGHIAGNVNLGNDKAVLLAVVTQLLPYIGYPRTLNAIGCLNEVLPE
ncbi:MAG: carboxymuconolactone decarboxylase family protein [Alistipes sp.]|uniref:Carboxymuconolactone decarboxylase family protein n=2 Tax=Rikenellaceae TaxID=171550 RepID=A0ABY5V6E3_9BACT|nr:MULTISPECIES: carboxymuconolactone decarboxylase family protein [Alistipes]MBQ7892699.1 carboxymuconolactone decarboxylase family protein [Alistipes sp.]MDY4570710.1 carboxymuconolactone decarboxylase family protein [Alistipes senegalensis]UEA87218.1 carboxymuconolactone decarboxylase family protein [Alistipes senegalensis]UWN65190.1 carboxymuconolactone decarboxylase family protein [Alistipes senegalensis JC50]